MTVTIASHLEDYSDIVKKFGLTVPVLGAYPQRLLDGQPAYVVDQGAETYKNWTMIKFNDCRNAGVRTR